MYLKTCPRTRQLMLNYATYVGLHLGPHQIINLKIKHFIMFLAFFCYSLFFIKPFLRSKKDKEDHKIQSIGENKSSMT